MFLSLRTSNHRLFTKHICVKINETTIKKPSFHKNLHRKHLNLFPMTVLSAIQSRDVFFNEIQNKPQ